MHTSARNTPTAWERTQSLLLTGIALAIGVCAVYVTFLRDGTPQPRHYKGWEAALPASHWLVGDSGAPVKVLVLTDLQCPACRAFHSSVERLESEHQGEVSVWYLQHPLSYHLAAMPAARAAQCAGEVGQFRAFVDRVFQEQNSLDEARWGALAAEAGISDTARISECARSDSIPREIEAGLRFGEAFELEGTPTVLLDGWEFPNPPSLREMELALEALSQGRRPHALARR